MHELFATGRVADVILGMMLLEGVGLVAYRRLTSPGALPPDVLLNLLSGAFLVLALRGALTGLAWGWLGASLAGALLAHLLALRHRLRG